MREYDVTVIGGGPGGYVAAIKSAQAGLKCAIVEKENLGGICLNWGCIPTKSLLRNAEILSNVKDSAEYGIHLQSDYIVDYSEAQKRSRKVSAKLVQGIKYLMNKNNIDVYSDEAAFEDSKTIQLKKSKEKISSKKFIIATGARSIQLSMANYENGHVLDYRRALSLTKVPKSVVVIGAGAIGMEFASVWNTYGANVTVIEMQPSVLPNEDNDVSKAVKAAYEKRGINIHTSAKVEKVEEKSETLKITYTADGYEKLIECEYLLISVGITPNSDLLNIDALGCKLDPRGYIITDSNFKTNINNVYAIGDVTGKLALAHVASEQGMIAVQHILGKQTEEMVYENVPKCTYGFPETASAGLTEEQAIEKGYDVQCGTFPLSANGKAISYGAEEGFVKVVSESKYGQMLGVHMVGHNVPELISNAVTYLKLELTLDEFDDLIFPHPTLSETIMEAIHCASGSPINI